MKKKFYVALAIIGAYLYFSTTALSQSKIFEKGAKETFMIVNPSNPRSGGTGFVLNTGSKQYTITNAHVCKISPNGTMLAIQGDRQIRLMILGINEGADLCVLDAVPNQKGLTVGKDVEMYGEVYIVGHPLLMPISVSAGWVRGRGVFGINYCNSMQTKNFLPQFVAEQDLGDILAALMDCVRPMNAIISNADIKPGNSGSAVLNDDGEVVGVAFAGDAQGTSLIVPQELLKNYLQQF